MNINDIPNTVQFGMVYKNNTLVTYFTLTIQNVSRLQIKCWAVAEATCNQFSWMY